MKKIIAVKVPHESFKEYERCKDCHLYGVINSYFSIQDDIGNTEFITNGCTDGKFEIENTNEVHRDCKYIHIEIDNDDLLSDAT